MGRRSAFVGAVARHEALSPLAALVLEAARAVVGLDWRGRLLPELDSPRDAGATLGEIVERLPFAPTSILRADSSAHRRVRSALHEIVGAGLGRLDGGSLAVERDALARRPGRDLAMLRLPPRIDSLPPCRWDVALLVLGADRHRRRKGRDELSVRDLAHALGLSRSAVCRARTATRSMGADIDRLDDLPMGPQAVPQPGYSLSETPGTDCLIRDSSDPAGSGPGADIEDRDGAAIGLDATQQAVCRPIDDGASGCPNRDTEAGPDRDSEACRNRDTPDAAALSEVGHSTVRSGTPGCPKWDTPRYSVRHNRHTGASEDALGAGADTGPGAGPGAAAPPPDAPSDAQEEIPSGADAPTLGGAGGDDQPAARLRLVHRDDDLVERHDDAPTIGGHPVLHDRIASRIQAAARAAHGDPRKLCALYAEHAALVESRRAADPVAAWFLALTAFDVDLPTHRDRRLQRAQELAERHEHPDALLGAAKLAEARYRDRGGIRNLGALLAKMLDSRFEAGHAEAKARGAEDLADYAGRWLGRDWTEQQLRRLGAIGALVESVALGTAPDTGTLRQRLNRLLNRVREADPDAATELLRDLELARRTAASVGVAEGAIDRAITWAWTAARRAFAARAGDPVQLAAFAQAVVDRQGEAVRVIGRNPTVGSVVAAAERILLEAAG